MIIKSVNCHAKCSSLNMVDSIYIFFFKEKWIMIKLKSKKRQYVFTYLQPFSFNTHSPYPLRFWKVKMPHESSGSGCELKEGSSMHLQGPVRCPSIFFPFLAVQSLIVSWQSCRKNCLGLFFQFHYST